MKNVFSSSVLLLLTVMGCQMTAPPDTNPGVSQALARHRQQTIIAPRYKLRFSIPQERSGTVQGEANITFELNNQGSGVVLDFDHAPSRITTLSINGEKAEATFTEDHILLPSDHLHRGRNEINVTFQAGDKALNRNDEFLYTLFVPDRASSAFPCFDQPNLKARFHLTLEIPDSWTAIANGNLRTKLKWKDRTILTFEQTSAIPTYLFSFVAGKFQVVTRERAGRTMRFLHRETDKARLERNQERLFDLHATALSWLEAYTGIPYPFGKFDFALIPSFQYNGMEHPGAILYRADALLLEKTPTQDQELRRASLIAHETAHMWFGNLVTMDWFNDVWMKEVFANFMAAKIVHPFFPKINHELRFLMAHYPAAYEVDRTAGANPIRQDLANLKEAGSLYGAIIYKKAPIVMRMLETLIGEASFREGVQTYLKDFAYRNATWPDLIKIFDPSSPINLAEWSRSWVEEAGRPKIKVHLTQDDNGTITELRLKQDLPITLRPQPVSILIGKERLPVTLDASDLSIEKARGKNVPGFLLPNGAGRGYGEFALDPSSQAYLVSHLPELPDPLVRGIAWITLWDGMLEGTIPPGALFDLAIRALKFEEEELNVSRILHDLTTIYWRYLSVKDRTRYAPNLESFLLERIESAKTDSLKSGFFRTYRSVALSEEGVVKLRKIYEGKRKIAGVSFSESDQATTALELALRLPEESQGILLQQQESMKNPDRRRRLGFVSPALSPDPAIREQFFQSLQDPKNREQEPWVLEALTYLNHPLRAEESIPYIPHALAWLEEIQATGDIFFPKRWLDATLWGHQSKEAADLVRTFLENRPAYPERLRGKILQSADGLFRAEKLLDR